MPTKNKKKVMTIDDLAVIVARGFEDVTKKFDDKIGGLRTEFHDFAKLAMDEFDRIRSDIRDIKTTLGPLVRIIAEQEKIIQDLRFRIARLERKVGLEK